MSKYFHKPKGKVNVELVLSNYATKTDFKNATGIDTSSFAEKVDLPNWESNVDKLDTDKLKNVRTNLSNLKNKVHKSDVDKSLLVPADLSKLSDVVKNDVVKKDGYNAKIKDIEDKMPNITNLATNTTLNAKINEGKGEISNINNWATTSALTVVKNKIPSVSNFVKKTNYNTKITEIENKNYWSYEHDKYITTPEFNKLTAKTFAARLKHAKLASKSELLISIIS